jgi:cytochrome c peroxidase
MEKKVPMPRTTPDARQTWMKHAVVASLLFLGQAALCGTPGASKPEAPMRDAWSPAETKVLSSLRLSQLPPTPADPSNAVEAMPAAADLGKKLFQDARLSANAKVSCASCHIATKQFQDGLPLGQGVGTGSRRTMPIIAAGHSPWLFWDGRKDSLWAQALGPLEDAAEHGGNRLSYAKLLQRHYRPAYEAVFGAMPDLKALPADASPNGSTPERAAWQTLAPETQKDVSRIFANLGKAIAAFEKTLPLGATRFDRYVEATFANDATASQWMTAQEANGLRIFIGKGQCVTCHNGPLLSDQSFHNTGVPPRAGMLPDRGRAGAIQKVQNDMFNCLGPFSDAKPAQCLELRFMSTSDPRMEGAFKTPSLRNVALRPPYMHAGQMASLEEVITHYMRAPAAPIGQTERKPLQLSVQEARDLALFLGTLSEPANGCCDR